MNKPLYFTTACAFLVITCSNVFAEQNPGWLFHEPLELQPLAVNPAAMPEAPPSAPPPPPEVSSLSSPPFNEADAITPEISALAAALGNDVTRIFLWVRNNIRFTHYFGCRKGATLTYYERSGNDADQAALLAATLRAAGHTVRYNAAWCFASNAVWADYFGVEVGSFGGPSSGYQVWISALSAGGITNSHVVPTNETPARWGVTRFWVEVETAGTWVRYDPSYKPFRRDAAAIDLAAASSYSDGFSPSRGSLLNAAGGTEGTNSVSGISAADLNAYLDARATALATTVSASYPNHSAQQAYGRTHFALLEPATSGALTANERFPWDVPSWTTYHLGGSSGSSLLSSTYLSTLRIVISATQGGGATLDKTFKFAELAGRNLTLEFDGAGATNQAVLRLDDVIVASEAVPIGTGASCWMRSTIWHPGSTNQGAVDTSYLRGARYALIYAVE
ncbi:MAG: hypothetical protein JNG86_11815, partial [Verrucomicrobiaceae bacterium]|nr:hypothetical protein [Verrucomicrobiaceae bacterium]